MANYKYSTIQDPYNCPIDELEKEVSRLTNLVDYFETKQLALKQFINSVYGAIASKYFIANNVYVAESITAQGQDLNHFSENSVNAYFNGIFQKDTELHKILGISTEDAEKFDISKGKTTDTGPLTGDIFSYLNGSQSLTVAGDTDSFSKNTELTLDDKKLCIESVYNILLKEANNQYKVTQNGAEIVEVNNHTTLTYANDEVVSSPIKYVMRHKVSKPMYRITTESGKQIEVTGDHSVMVLRNNELISVKTEEIDIDNDKIITIV